MRDSDLAHIVEQLSREPDEELTLQQVADLAVANVPGCDMCSIFVRLDGQVDSAATTDAQATQVDDLQFELDEGPCLSVLEDREVATVTDTAAEARWPRWAAGAAAHGVGSSLSVRLTAQSPYLACLNLYSRQVDGFDEDSVELAIVYARLASVALVQARETSGLRSALHHRLVIGAAQGVLMERYGLGLDRAFEVLRRRSNETNTKLHSIAQAVLDGVDVRSG